MNTITVIIPCFREKPEKVRSLVDHVLTVFHNDVQVIVSDQSHDEGLQNLIDQYHPTDHRVVYTPSPGSCRAHTMNHGASFATGDILVFLHADNTLPLQAYDELSMLELTQYSGGGFMKLFSPITLGTSLMSVGRNLWRSKSKKLFGDNTIFCSRKAWETIGGYADMQLFEDVDFSDKLSTYAHTHDQKIYLSPYPTITSSRKYIDHGFWRVFRLQMKLQIRYHLGWYDDKKFAQAYYGKKNKLL